MYLSSRVSAQERILARKGTSFFLYTQILDSFLLFLYT